MLQKQNYFSRPSVYFFLNLSLLFLYSALLTFQSEWIFRSSFTKTWHFIFSSFGIVLLITMILFLFQLVLYFLIRKPEFAMLISGLLVWLLSTINYVKATYRNDPLYPWDFFNTNEAVSILPKVKIQIPLQSIVSIITVVLISAGIFYLRKYHLPKLRFRIFWPFRIGFAVLTAVILTCLVNFTLLNPSFLNNHNIIEIKWAQISGFQRNGFLSSFLMDLRYVTIPKPKNYSISIVDDATKNIKKQPSGSVKPNVILIQDESFSDVDRFKGITMSADVMSTIDNLRQNYISGYAFTPMFGGGTCNSEFEVITSFPYSNLPTGSTPYQQYLNKKTPSYASYLEQSGYNSVAIHDFDRNFWNRNNVFPNIGFQKFVAEDDFSNPVLKRSAWYVSDMDCFKRIISEYNQNKSTGKPFFNFTITMQNHESYPANDYPTDELVKIDAPDMSQTDKGSLETYATGVYEANIALQYLIDYFSTVQDPTIIVFYGDHLPGLSTSTFTTGKYIQGDPNSAANFGLMHSTPFVMWSNYDKTHIDSVNLSMYELIPYMTKCYDLQRPLYYDFLLNQFNSYRGYASNVYIDSSNQYTFQRPQGATPFFDTNYLFEYDQLFGHRYGSALFK